MAILDQSYQPWSGDLLPRWARVAAFIKVGIRQAYAGWVIKIGLLFTYSVVFSLVGVLFIVANLRLPPIWAQGNLMYRYYLGEILPAGLLFMILGALVGGRAIAIDLRNNAVAMYFSKAITRLDYVLAKVGIVGGFLLSATLLPGIILWLGNWSLVQDSLTISERLSDLLGITLQSFALVIPMTLYLLALSSLSRNGFVPGVLWVMTYLGSTAVSSIMTATVGDEWCKLISWPNLLARIGELAYAVRAVRKTPFAVNVGADLPTMTFGWGPPLAILAAISIVSTIVVFRRLRRFEGRE